MVSGVTAGGNQESETEKILLRGAWSRFFDFPRVYLPFWPRYLSWKIASALLSFMKDSKCPRYLFFLTFWWFLESPPEGIRKVKRRKCFCAVRDRDSLIFPRVYLPFWPRYISWKIASAPGTCFSMSFDVIWCQEPPGIDSGQNWKSSFLGSPASFLTSKFSPERKSSWANDIQFLI